MTTKLIRELPTMEAKLEATRQRLRNHGVERLAVLEATNPPCQALATQLGSLAIEAYPDRASVLAASELRGVASIVPLMEAGQPVQHDGSSMQAAIAKRGRLAIAAIDMMPLQHAVLLAVVAAPRT